MTEIFIVCDNDAMLHARLNEKTAEADVKQLKKKYTSNSGHYVHTHRVKIVDDKEEIKE